MSAIPAATLVLFRDSEAGPEHLFVERAASMAFAGGAIVFPGGRVDAGDRTLGALRPDLDPDDSAARVAAIRETIEEAGLAIGVVGALDLPATRAALAGGASLGALLAAAGARLDLDALVPFARWCPAPREQARTFDTHFYLARAIAGDTAEVDRTENVRLFWATAADVLAQADAGTIRMIFPTRRNLERLALSANFVDACADAAAHPLDRVVPWVEERADGPQLCIPTHLGYPITAVPLALALRG